MSQPGDSRTATFLMTDIAGSTRLWDPQWPVKDRRAEHRRVRSRALFAALVLAVAACGTTGDPVALRTVAPAPSGVGCYLSGVNGELVVDAEAGTAIVEDNGQRTPVIWPYRYTGRRSGGEVTVLDQAGNVVARTGTRVHLPGGYQDGWLTCFEGVKALP